MFKGYRPPTICAQLDRPANSKTKTIGKHHEQLNVTLDSEELEQVTEFVLPWWPGNGRCKVC